MTSSKETCQWCRGYGVVTAVGGGTTRCSCQGAGTDRTASGTVDQAEDTDAGEARRAIGRLISDRRDAFTLDVARVLNRAATLSQALGNALGGEISRAEAVDALKREINESLERLR